MQEQIRRSLATLLAEPAAAPSLREWSVSVEQALLRDLRMDLAGLVLGAPGGGDVRSATFTHAAAFMSRHYATNAGDQRRRRLRLTSWVRRMLWPDPVAFKQSDYFAEIIAPMRYFDAGGCSTTLDGVESVLYVGRHRELSIEEEDLRALQRLQPAFATGVALLTALDSVLDDIGTALGRAGSAAAVVRENGSFAHVTPRLAAELDEAGASLSEAVRAAAQERWAGGALMPQELRVECAAISGLTLRYLLRTSLIPARRGWPLDAVIVLVEPQPDEARRMLAIRRRFQLTERESGILPLLLAGLTDRQIAERLGISWHTARRHVERILGKMQCERRSQLQQKLDDPVS